MKRSYLLIILFSLFATIFSSIYGVKEEIGVIEITSLVLFLVTLIIGMTKKKLFIVFLIFNVLAVPSALNNFVPSIPLGYYYEKGNASFPLITFLDFYILIGALRFNQLFTHNKITNKIHPIVIMILVQILILLLHQSSLEEKLVIISGLWQIRLLVPLWFIGSNLKSADMQFIKQGLLLSLIFLIIESFAFTHLRLGGILNHKLTSGSLGTNTYGNFISATFMFFFYQNKSFFKLMILTLSLFLIIMTGTLMSLLVIVITPLLYNFIISKGKFYPIVLFCASITLILIYLNELIGVDVETVIRIFTDKNFNIYGIGIVNPDNSSVLSRLLLYSVSFRMIFNNPFLGIGQNMWNLEKYNYGFTNFFYIDSHNGYLTFLSTYGLILGFMLIYTLRGFLINRNISLLKKEKSIIGFLLALSIADLSNSSTYKIQIFSIVVLFTAYAQTLIDNSKNNIYDKFLISKKEQGSS